MARLAAPAPSRQRRGTGDRGPLARNAGSCAAIDAATIQLPTPERPATCNMPPLQPQHRCQLSAARGSSTASKQPGMYGVPSPGGRVFEFCS
eukprot:356753-Chlamydomonas_euryale.AAC.8